MSTGGQGTLAINFCYSFSPPKMSSASSWLDPTIWKRIKAFTMLDRGFTSLQFGHMGPVNRRRWKTPPLSATSLSDCTAGGAASSPTGKDVANRPPYTKCREYSSCVCRHLWGVCRSISQWFLSSTSRLCLRRGATDTPLQWSPLTSRYTGRRSLVADQILWRAVAKNNMAEFQYQKLVVNSLLNGLSPGTRPFDSYQKTLKNSVHQNRDLIQLV